MVGIRETVDVPVIDISGYFTDDVNARDAIVQQIRDACEGPGFFQITGHTVPPATQKRFTNALAEFFSLPASEKDKISQAKSKCRRGYEKFGAQKLEQLDKDATADQKEAFSARQDRPLGDFPLQGPNQWPDEVLPHFKEVYLEYFHAVEELSKSMFRMMALSLGLPEEYFDEFAMDPDGISSCRSHHYPPTPFDATGLTRGVGAHTDFGTLTLLLQDTVGGLEVLDPRTQTWLAVPPVEGAFVVNIGDLMERWTNKRYNSTMHRVTAPLSGKDRYSCAFFLYGPLEHMVECIPTCLRPGEQPMFEPIKVKDHLLKRFTQSYV